MPRIALSYRRADSAAISGRIFDRLVQHYGPGNVFMDIDEIPFGIDFREHVSGVLASCDAVVVVIGTAWLGGDVPPRRIDEETDPVRVEVQTALERTIPVIPILVHGAAMPAEADLPVPLRPLAYRNACHVDTGRDFHAHVDRLIRSMDRVLGSERPPAPPAVVPVDTPGPTARTPPVRPPPMSPARIAILAGFLILPQLAQFSQRTPVFVVALLASAIGTATLLDREDQRMTARITTIVLVITLALIGQASLGVLRASLVEW